VTPAAALVAARITTALRWSDALPSRESYARAVAVTVRVRRG
jgi:hypothetical protein